MVVEYLCLLNKTKPFYFFIHYFSQKMFLKKEYSRNVAIYWFVYLHTITHSYMCSCRCKYMSNTWKCTHINTKNVMMLKQKNRGNIKIAVYTYVLEACVDISAYINKSNTVHKTAVLRPFRLIFWVLWSYGSSKTSGNQPFLITCQFRDTLTYLDCKVIKKAGFHSLSNCHITKVFRKSAEMNKYCGLMHSIAFI